MEEMTLEQRRAMALANARLRLQGGSSGEPAAPKPMGAPQELTFAEKYIAPLLENAPVVKDVLAKAPEGVVRGLVQGGADAQIGAAQMLAPEGSAVDQGIKKQLAGYEASRGEDKGSFDFARMGGSLLGPLSLLTGGAGATTGALSRVGQGMGVGAISGATNPIEDGKDFWGTKASNTAMGTVLGGLIPGGWEVAKKGGGWIRDLVQPSLGKWGAERSAGRLANTVSGEGRDKVIDALATAQDIVPGSKLTAGQASVPAGSAEFAALMEIAGRNKPTPAAARASEQQAARAAVIGDIAKTPKDLAAAKAARGASADADYGAAYAQAIKADPELARLSSNPYFEKAMPAAMELAKARGVDPKTNLTEFLQFVKEGLDQQLSKRGDDALSRTAQDTVGEVKTQLLDWLARKNPQFEKARATFAAESKPINEMVVGAQLQKALTSGSGKERVTAFTNAVDNATQIPELRKRSGAARFGSMDDVLGPKMGGVQNVVDDMKRGVQFDELASAGMPRAQKMVGDFEPSKFVNPLERTIMVINALVSRAAGRGSKRTMDSLADLSMNPAQMAEAMKKAKPWERSQIIDAMMRANAAQAGQYD